MEERWFKEAVIYCLEVDTFQDSNGDGQGDLRGLIARLDYLARLGVTCLWLGPIHPTPNRDDGYDIADYYGVDPRLGSLGDFVDLIHQASNRGLRIMIDLVVNHTSDQHRWFQSARSDPDSPYRDWYVWSQTEPADKTSGVVFPGVQDTTWSYDKKARAWYYHRFYDFQPDLNWANPDVRAEMARVVAFWLQLGVSGFRMDAAPFVIEDVHPDQPTPRREYRWLKDLRTKLSWRRGDAVILAEANVPRDERAECFAAFGPKETMQLYGRGIRRRLAPMLGGDRRRIELAYGIQCALPGTPVLRYGEEIGMGDDLALPERNALRTPMQWSDQANAGFSSADAEQLIRPIVSGGAFGYEKVNVDAQRSDDASLLTWFERMLRTLRECAEFGTGTCTMLDPGTEAVIALRFDAPTGTVVAVSNLRDEPCQIDLGPELPGDTHLLEVFANRRYQQKVDNLSKLDLDGWGYRWLRIR